MKIGSTFAPLFKQAKESDTYWVEKASLEFTERVLKEMKSKGITQSVIAEKLGISAPSLSNHLRTDGHNITLSTMIRIARVVGLNIEIQFNGSGKACITEKSCFIIRYINSDWSILQGKHYWNALRLSESNVDINRPFTCHEYILYRKMNKESYCNEISST